MRAAARWPMRARANAGPTGGIVAGFALIGTAMGVGAAIFAMRGRQETVPAPSGPLVSGRAHLPSSPAIGHQVAVRAARQLNRAAGTIAGAVLFDSGIEHYRGSFHNKAMVTPLVASALSVAASLHGAQDGTPAPHRARDAVFAAAALTGVLGTGFHIYDVGKKPGGFCWQNLFYSAPLGAPAALLLSGLMGFLAERVRDNRPGTLPTILGLAAGRAVAAATGVGLLGTVGEAGLLHFRGAFHNPIMLLPVTMPPIAAALLGATAFAPARQPRPRTRWFLRLTALLGVGGVGFHAMGVARGMGGWRNWRQNLLNGPPIPAPPAFTGLALAGLAALELLEDQPDD